MSMLCHATRTNCDACGAATPLLRHDGGNGVVMYVHQKPLIYLRVANDAHNIGHPCSAIAFLMYPDT